MGPGAGDGWQGAGDNGDGAETGELEEVSSVHVWEVVLMNVGQKPMCRR